MSQYLEHLEALELHYGSICRFPDQEQWPRITHPVFGTDIPLPPFATVEQALERADHECDNTVRHIRLMAAHGNEWPLWETLTREDCPYGPTEPRDYGLSDGLANDLHSWFSLWLSQANAVMDGQLSSETRMPLEWEAAGHHLLKRLAVEVWPLADVSIQLPSP